MNARKRKILAAIVACAALVIVSTTRAHNPGFDVPSPGMPAAVININGIEGGGEWAGAAVFAMADYGAGNPLSASVKALHKSDGIYLLAIISDPTNNNSDAIQIRFDINHNGGLNTEATDWGTEILRSGQATWGPANASPATWTPPPGGTVSVTTTGANWTVEFHLPTGAPSNLALATGTVGVHLELFDVDQVFGANSAKYNQWPQPGIADLEAMLDATPNLWGNYMFDPATTFPNIALTNVRRGGGVGVSEYYTISHTLANTFQVTVNNPGGTAVSDATGVRLNLYIGAVGLGEPFHRLDAGATIDADCNPFVPNLSLPQGDVCLGNVSLPDVETIANNVLVTNTAKYTVKNGATRAGGSNITINGGMTNDVNVVVWDTTVGQDPKYDFMTVNGTTYDRKHSCMRAEALVPNDPNVSDNTRQVNMNFECVPGGAGGGAMARFHFGIGAAAFAKYNPAIGKNMFIEVSRKNMPPQMGWNFKLSDRKGQIRKVKDNQFVARLKGTQSIGAVLDIVAPRPEALGRTLKEHLIIPPKAGGRQSNARVPSGDTPVYVKVRSGSTLLIANFALHSKEDAQYVDLDGERRLLPANGPAGLSNELLRKARQEIAELKLLLSPTSPLGSLVGSFDNFKTSFLIAEGAQVRVPAGAQYLALGINDGIGLFGDNTGTGFRIKVVERAPGTIASLEPGILDGLNIIPTAHAQPGRQRQVIPLEEVIPTLCFNGYEQTRNTRVVANGKRELYRYIGNVCWGIVNVFPRNRSERPDKGDPFDEKRGGRDGSDSGGIALFPFIRHSLITGRSDRNGTPAAYQ